MFNALSVRRILRATSNSSDADSSDKRELIARSRVSRRASPQQLSAVHLEKAQPSRVIGCKQFCETTASDVRNP
jgi:hypothetical protein